MKKVCFSIFLLIGMLSAQTSFAQANNNTDEDWVINYYGGVTYVNANDTGVPINVGTDCSEGINVRSLDTANCGHEFTAPGIWTAACTTQTATVEFISNGPPPACFSTVTTYGDPEFNFD